jgi:hypothetical protein
MAFERTEVDGTENCINTMAKDEIKSLVHNLGKGRIFLIALRSYPLYT